MSVLYIIRGLPGSGKSTLAAKLCPGFYFEADMFFTDPDTGVYTYDGSKIADAHSWCMGRVLECMIHDIEQIAVSNTFSRKWEYEDYLRYAEHYGYQVIEVTLKSNFKSIHNVPVEQMEKMRARWEV